MTAPKFILVMDSKGKEHQTLPQVAKKENKYNKTQKNKIQL